MGSPTSDSAPSMIRAARVQAGLSQSQLARRLGISQAAVAKLERPRANPTIGTLQSTMRALGRKLVLSTEPAPTSVDDTLIAAQLRLSPQERLERLEQMYQWGMELQQAGAKARGESA